MAGFVWPERQRIIVSRETIKKWFLAGKITQNKLKEPKKEKEVKILLWYQVNRIYEGVYK